MEQRLDCSQNGEKMITFENEKQLNYAVREYIANNLTIEVNLVPDGDYYSRAKVPQVIVKLDGMIIAEDKAG